MTNMWSRPFGGGGVATLALLLVALQHGPAAADGSEATPGAVLRVRVVLHTTVDPAELALARRTAEELLQHAGIGPIWSTCDALVESCGSSNTAGTLTLRILPTNVSARHAGGHLVRDFQHGSTALIHVPWHEALTHAIRHSSAGRSDPSLATLTAGHTMGLTIAHEVGHALGLPHTSRGVMKPMMDREDLRALRGDRLSFEHKQSNQMRQALLAGAARNSEARIED